MTKYAKLGCPATLIKTKLSSSAGKILRGFSLTNYHNLKIYLTGGRLGNDAVDPSGTTMEYDTQINNWAMGPKLCHSRQNHGSTILAGKLYVFGGRGV